MSDFYRKLEEVVGEAAVRADEPMAGHTTFRTGGRAAYLVLAESVERLRDILLLCREEERDCCILGNGSNLLVGSRGYGGVMIRLSGSLAQVEAFRQGGREFLAAGAGALLSRIGQEALRRSLTGFEFASGIPGTLGGAVVMNAGAYGGEIKDVVRSVEVMTREGQLLTLDKGEMDFSYRHSCVTERGYVVVRAVLALEQGDRGQIGALMEELALRRREKQPLEFPSAGSTFKRPDGNFAGKLIEEAGLRGFSQGGAQVSEKHCGFVINRGGAAPEDVLSLIRQIQRRVYENSGVFLEPEVRLIGFSEE